MKDKAKKKRAKLPRGIRRAADGRLIIYATDPAHRAIRRVVTWEYLRELEVEVEEISTLEQPGVRLAQDALGALKAKFRAEKKLGIVAATAKVKIAECYQLVLDEYIRLRRKSLRDLKSRWKNHLKDTFGDVSANRLTTAMLDRYVRRRLGERAASATVNKELAIIKHGLKLGQACTPPLVVSMPRFPMLKEPAPRQGFLTDATYEKLAQECSAEGLWLRGIFSIAGSFAWRKGEVVNLRVRQLDFPGHLIRLDVGSTKNDDGRVVRMTGEAFQLLSACAENKAPEDFVFTRDRERIRDFRGAWANACARAGCPDLLFHDLRRTGARNLRRLGVSEGVIMRMGGWRTRSVFDRYNIVDESDLADAASKLDQKRAAMDAEKPVNATDKKTDILGKALEKAEGMVQ